MYLCDLSEEAVIYWLQQVLCATCDCWSLFACPSGKNINGYYEGNICAVLTFAPCPVSRCDSIINDRIRAVPALRMFCTSQVPSLLFSSESHAKAQAVVRQAYHREGTASIPDYFMWYLR
jgi:hypothetical protein